MKKKILALCVVIAMLALAVIGGTMAYFTDAQTEDNAFVVGNIDIELWESNGTDANNGGGNSDDYKNWLAKQVIYPGVEVAKNVQVANVGANDAYVRVIIFVPAGLEPVWFDTVGEGMYWTIASKMETTVDGVSGVEYVLEHDGPVTGNTNTEKCLKAITIDPLANYDNENGPFMQGMNPMNVKVTAQAIQAAGFENAKAAYAALDTQVALDNGDITAVSTSDGLVAALEAGEDVLMTEDVIIDPASMSNAYGTTGINVKNGQTIDGGGNILDIKGAGGTWDSGINTTGGIIRNITITGSFRGIFVNHNSDHSEPVVLDNVTIDGTVYTISCDQGANQTLVATNSTFNGWTSYAATIGNATFTNCTFGEGSGYAFLRPYASTTFVNCEFEAGYEMDPRAEVTFENCTLDGVPITEENLATLVTSNSANASVK